MTAVKKAAHEFLPEVFYKNASEEITRFDIQKSDKNQDRIQYTDACKILIWPEMRYPAFPLGA